MFAVKKTISDAVGTLKSPLSGASMHSHQSRRASAIRRETEGATIFCSDMYSAKFILHEMEMIAENPKINKVTFECLIARDDPEVLQKVKQFLVNTSCDGDKELSLARIAHNVTSSATNGAVQRRWQSVTFVECISDPQDYRHYLAKKQEFHHQISRHLAMKNMNFVLPIRFQTRLEIHCLSSLVSILEMLRIAERDKEILKVDFPQFKSKMTPKRIARKLTKQVDPEELEWTGAPLEMLLSYDGDDVIVSNRVEPTRGSVMAIDRAIASGKSARALLRASIKALERILYGFQVEPSADRTGSERRQSSTGKPKRDEPMMDETEILADDSGFVIQVRRLGTDDDDDLTLPHDAHDDESSVDSGLYSGASSMATCSAESWVGLLSHFEEAEVKPEPESNKEKEKPSFDWFGFGSLSHSEEKLKPEPEPEPEPALPERKERPSFNWETSTQNFDWEGFALVANS